MSLRRCWKRTRGAGRRLCSPLGRRRRRRPATLTLHPGPPARRATSAHPAARARSGVTGRRCAPSAASPTATASDALPRKSPQPLGDVQKRMQRCRKPRTLRELGRAPCGSTLAAAACVAACDTILAGHRFSRVVSFRRIECPGSGVVKGSLWPLGQLRGREGLLLGFPGSLPAGSTASEAGGRSHDAGTLLCCASSW